MRLADVGEQHRIVLTAVKQADEGSAIRLFDTQDKNRAAGTQDVGGHGIERIAAGFPFRHQIHAVTQDGGP